MIAPSVPGLRTRCHQATDFSYEEDIGRSESALTHLRAVNHWTRGRSLKTYP